MVAVAVMCLRWEDAPLLFRGQTEEGFERLEYRAALLCMGVQTIDDRLELFADVVNLLVLNLFGNLYACAAPRLQAIFRIGPLQSWFWDEIQIRVWTRIAVLGTIPLAVFSG